MKFELKHIDTGIDVVLTTENEDPDEVSEIMLSTPNTENSPESIEILETLIRELAQTRGIYGHLVDPLGTSNTDLAIALNFLLSFKLVKSPEIPELTSVPEDALS